MYDNIGGKIKIIAIAMFVIATGLCFFYGIQFVQNCEELIGIMIMLGGPIAGYIFSLFVYGFGEIIDSLIEISYNTKILRKEEFVDYKDIPKVHDEK